MCAIDCQPPPVTEVYELKFLPDDYFWYRHCVFVTILESGAVYVFDPTGVQFGPTWPVLSKWADYRRDRFGPNAQAEVRYLGRNAEWQASGWRAVY
jgi:hypothetical protein